MLSNFLQNLINRLNRQKLDTALLFITIGVGLVFFICIISFIDLSTADVKPELNRSRSLFLEESKYLQDDKFDHRYKLQGGYPAFTSSFIEKHIQTLKTPEKVGLYSRWGQSLTFGSVWDRKRFRPFFTDANLLQIISLDFVYGKAYTQDQLDNNEPVIIIDQKMSEFIFGNENPIGKLLPFKEGIEKSLKIIGVYKPISSISDFSAKCFIPYNLRDMNEDEQNEEGKYVNRGYFQAIVVAKSKGDMPLVKTELEKVITGLNESGVVEEYEGIQANFIDTNEKFFKPFGFDQDISNLAFVLLLFSSILLIPIFTIIKINITLANGRAHELGLRRSFGSTRMQVIKQYLFENLLVTMTAGVFGVVLSYFAFNFLMSISYPDDPTIAFSLNSNVLLQAMIIIVLFSLLTGLIPAIKISRLDPVKALKDNISSGKRSRNKSSIATLASIYIGMVIMLGMAFSSLLTILEKRWATDIKAYEVHVDNEGNNEAYKANFQTTREQLKTVKGIKNFSFHSQASPFQGYGMGRKYVIDEKVTESRFNTLRIESGYPHLLNYPIKKGRWFTEEDLENEWTAMVISPASAQKFFDTEDCIGRNITNEDGVYYKIVGIVEHRTLGYGGDWDAEKVFVQNKSHVYQLMFEPEESVDLEQLVERINDRLTYASVFEIRPISELVEKQLKGDLPQLKFIGTIIIIMLINAGVGFFIIGWGQVKKRLIEIGVRRSAGATSGTIYRMIIWENIRVTLIALGIALIPLSQIIIFGGDNFFSTKTWVYACIVSFVITITFMIISIAIPARRAARVQPVDALSEE